MWVLFVVKRVNKNILSFVVSTFFRNFGVEILGISKITTLEIYKLIVSYNYGKTKELFNLRW